MYILHETIAGNDPRLHASMKLFGNYWHYTIHYIPEGENVFVDWLKGEQISEQVAKAHKFTGAVNGELSIKTNTTTWEEIAQASSETATGPKHIYELSMDDNNNCIILMKTIIKNYAKNRLKSDLISQADAATTIDQLKSIIRGIVF